MSTTIKRKTVKKKTAKKKKGTTTVKKGIRPVRKSAEVKIDWFKRQRGLAEVYSTGLEYCLISKDNKQVCPLMLCKDFLQDAVWAWHNNRSCSIYGFTYNRKTGIPICFERTKIALGNGADPQFSDKMPLMVDFINQFEQKIKLVRSSVRKISNPVTKYKSGMWLMESSNRWMIAPPMLSLYGLLVRVGFTHKKGAKYENTIKALIDGKVNPYQNNDKGQIAQAKPGIDLILKYGYTKIFGKSIKKNYPGEADIHTMHGGTGICAFSGRRKREAAAAKGPKTSTIRTSNNNNFFSHWYRDLGKKKKTGAAK